MGKKYQQLKMFEKRGQLAQEAIIILVLSYTPTIHPRTFRTRIKIKIFYYEATESGTTIFIASQILIHEIILVKKSRLFPWTKV